MGTRVCTVYPGVYTSINIYTVYIIVTIEIIACSVPKKKKNSQIV